LRRKSGVPGDRSSSLGWKSRHTFVVILDGGPATAFGFRLV
jgi:hypothetical protein